MSFFEFKNSEFLWLLIAIPILFAWLVKGVRSGAVGLSSLQLLSKRQHQQNPLSAYILASLRCLALAAIVVALAGPRRAQHYTEVNTSVTDIMLAVDLSGSMIAHDFELKGVPTSRLGVVKQVLENFVEKRASDALGLVLFAKDAFLASPITANKTHLEKLIRSLEIGMIDEKATAIGMAMGMCINGLKELDAKSKLIILLTDGENNSGKISPSVAADIAAKEGIKVYTIAAGTSGLVPVPIINNGQYMRDANGQKLFTNVQMSVDEETLKEISEKTGGRFFRATDTASLEAIYEEIDQLEKRDATIYQYAQYAELFSVPLSIGLLLLFLELLLKLTRFRRLP